MKRFRLGTLLLLVAIAALGIAMVVQQRRAARREAEFRAQMTEKDALVDWYRAYDTELKERLRVLGSTVCRPPSRRRRDGKKRRESR